MTPAIEDLENRRPVWLALSDLFLDTELEANNLSEIARILSESPYALAQLETVLYHEVYPVCCTNLRPVTGVWDGFDPAWLESAILRRTQRISRWGRFFQWNRWMIRDDWNRVKELMLGNLETQHRP